MILNEVHEFLNWDQPHGYFSNLISNCESVSKLQDFLQLVRHEKDRLGRILNHFENYLEESRIFCEEFENLIKTQLNPNLEKSLKGSYKDFEEFSQYSTKKKELFHELIHKLTKNPPKNFSGLLKRNNRHKRLNQDSKNVSQSIENVSERSPLKIEERMGFLSTSGEKLFNETNSKRDLNKMLIVNSPGTTLNIKESFYSPNKNSYKLSKLTTRETRQVGSIYDCFLNRSHSANKLKMYKEKC